MKLIADISTTGRPLRVGHPSDSAPLFADDGPGLWVNVTAADAAYQDVSATTPATPGDSVAYIADRSASGVSALQSTATLRPLLGRKPIDAPAGGQIDQGTGPLFLRFDHVDDALGHTLPAGLEGDLMVFGRGGSWIVRGITVAPGDTLTLGPDSFPGAYQGVFQALGEIVGWVATDRSLTAREQSSLISYYKTRGAKGLLTPGPELLSNGDFASGSSGWSVGPGWSITGGIATHVPPQGSDLTQSGPLSANAVYLASVNITTVRTASLAYIKPGVTPYILLSGDMSPGPHSLVFQTGDNTSQGFGLRAGGPSDVDFNNISLRELRPQEAW